MQSTAEQGSLLPGVTIVVPCKGRFSHLRVTVPRLLRQRISCEFLVVVVDYGDPDECYEWVARQKDPRLCAIRVRDGVDEFNLSRARNCGACIVPHQFVAFTDADAMLGEHWLESALSPIMAGEAIATIPDWPWPEPGIPPACGISVLRTSLFHQVRGFDETFQGWGNEDKDFIGRISQLGAIGSFSSELVELIPHDTALRVAHYSNKHQEVSNLENQARASRRRGPVNPLGYGSKKLDIFQCSRTALKISG